MSDDLVKRLRKFDWVLHELEIVDQAAERIEELSNCVAVLEAKLSKSEALLAKAVVNLRTYAPCLVDGPEHDVGYYYGYHTALNRILDTIEELKGQDDE